MAVNMQDVACQRLKKEVIEPFPREPPTGTYWPMLLFDEQSLRVVNACCELYSNVFDRVTMFDDLGNDVLRYPRYEAIYLITPCGKSIQQIKKDFQSADYCRFKAAHVYFTYACPPMLLQELMEHPAWRYIKTVKVVNLGFVAYEPQVFSLDYREACHMNYNAKDSETCDAAVMERIAAQIVTLCVPLGEFPRIRYRADRESINERLAVLVQQKLATNDAGFRKGPQTELLILDRGFDYVSPLLHELTLQAMAYDCLPLRNHFDRYVENELKTPKLKNNVFLKECLYSWEILRHKHIAEAIKYIANRQEKFPKPPELNDVIDRPLTDIWRMIAQVPQYRSEIALTYSRLQVIDRCLSSYETKVKKLFNLEQELVVGTGMTGKKLKNLMRKVDTILIDCNMSYYDKMRLILLLALTKKIAPENDLIKLSQLAGISHHECKSILNTLARSDDFVAGVNHEMLGRSATQNNDTEHASERSRWIPALKRVAEDATKGKLDQKRFPVLTDSVRPSAPDSELPPNQDKSVRKVVILIIGGLTYSEMRSVYEVNAGLENCEVLVGGTHFLTPEGFIDDLKNFTKEQSETSL